MNNRNKIVLLCCLVFATAAFVMSLYFASALLKDKQPGKFTVSFCETHNRYLPETCRGFFVGDLVEIYDAEVYTFQFYQPGEVVDATVYGKDRVVISTNAQLWTSFMFAFGGSIFAISASYLVINARIKKPKNTEPALTQNVSTWSHIAFFSGLLTIFPVSLITGILGVIDSTKNSKLGVWRSWVGIVLGLVFSWLYYIAIFN